MPSTYIHLDENKLLQNPSVDDICELHERYSNALEDLYNQYNPLYGDKQVKLVIT